MISKKEFEALADSFVEAWERIHEREMGRAEAYIVTRGQIMKTLKELNPNFCVQRFMSRIAEKQEY